MAELRAKPAILCVDDEPQVLEGLGLSLRRMYELHTAQSGPAGLEVLAQQPTIAVIVSDMRMPGMDGATFLARAREISPTAVRLLLTGQADIESAIAAVNEGQIFRFLAKPCPPPTLLAAVGTAVEQHQLITAERVLLEQTLHGAIKLLTDILGLVSPASFGRAMRIKRLVTELADHLGISERWQVEVAAMLSQLGYITLPAETAEKAYYGRLLSVDEQAQVGRLPALTEELLGNVPRMEVVREILKTYPKPYSAEHLAQSDPRTRVAVQGAHLLKVVVDFDALESTPGTSVSLAVNTLRGRAGQYAPEILEALADIRGAEQTAEIRELSAGELRVGMVLAEDVAMPGGGVLLVARGHEVTPRLLERIRNFPPEVRKNSKWRVVVRPSPVK